MAAPALLIVDTGLPPLRPETSGPPSPEPSSVAVIVLGGEPWTRPQRGAEAFKETRSSLVIVSGNGDCEDVRRLLEAREVRASVILTECESGSTYENARFSVALLREHRMTNAIVVTSWYHSRRALACFRKAAPNITFYSSPTPVPATKPWWLDGYQRGRVSMEYVKLVYYWMFHGVSPWG